MSYTTMFIVPQEGPVESVEEFNNAFFGAIAVWDTLARRYFSKDYSLTDQTFSRAVWNLWQVPDGVPGEWLLGDDERVALLCTFDHAILERSEWERAIQAFDQFTETARRIRGTPCSLSDQARVIERLIQEYPDAAGICWQQTSVAADAWEASDSEVEDGYRPYDISKDTGHWFVGQALAEAQRSALGVIIPPEVPAS